ncbi:class II aldolase/adducin family protein [Streptomyces sp. AA1529]|uniref:class II aldolase/adducin family protein n=1 Tax=Streptomyces sp. AA1529 TaxID=1203257 RepID=UPI003D70A5FF
MRRTGRASAAPREPLGPLAREACAFHEDHALLARWTGVAVVDGDGARIAAVPGPHKAVILRNHGLSAVGDPADAAAW